MGESRRKPQRRGLVSASADLSRSLVFPDDGPVQRKFRQQFGPEIDAFIANIFETHRQLEATAGRWPKTVRAQQTRMFLHVALNSLYCSVHFLVSGYFGPAGHQLRVFAEASAMAMLMLTDREWADFSAKQEQYKAHEALHRVTIRKNKAVLERKLNLKIKNWVAFTEMTRLYDHHSHAGAFTTMLAVKMEWPYSPILGGEYDHAKRAEYKADLKRATAGAKALRALVDAIDGVASELA